MKQMRNTIFNKKQIENVLRKLWVLKWFLISGVSVQGGEVKWETSKGILRTQNYKGTKNRHGEAFRGSLR